MFLDEVSHHRDKQGSRLTRTIEASPVLTVSDQPKKPSQSLMVQDKNLSVLPLIEEFVKLGNGNKSKKQEQPLELKNVRKSPKNS